MIGMIWAAVIRDIIARLWYPYFVGCNRSISYYLCDLGRHVCESVRHHFVELFNGFNGPGLLFTISAFENAFEKFHGVGLFRVSL